MSLGSFCCTSCKAFSSLGGVFDSQIRHYSTFDHKNWDQCNGNLKRQCLKKFKSPGVGV